MKQPRNELERVVALLEPAEKKALEDAARAEMRSLSSQIRAFICEGIRRRQNDEDVGDAA